MTQSALMSMALGNCHSSSAVQELSTSRRPTTSLTLNVQQKDGAKKPRGTVTTHRLLTSDEVFQLKLAQKDEKGRKEREKQARNEKAEGKE